MTGQAPGMRLAEGEAEGLRWRSRRRPWGSWGQWRGPAGGIAGGSRRNYYQARRARDACLSGPFPCPGENKLDESLDTEYTARIIDVSRGRIAAEGGSEEHDPSAIRCGSREG
jgi:hypothetical protein